MLSGSVSDSSMMANWSPPSRAIESPGPNRRLSRRATVSRIVSPTVKPTGLLILAELVNIDVEHRRAHHNAAIGQLHERIETVDEQFAVFKARQIVAHRILQQPISEFLLSVISPGFRYSASLRHDAKHRSCLQAEPVIMAVDAANPERLRNSPALVFQDAFKG